MDVRGSGLDRHMAKPFEPTPSQKRVFDALARPSSGTPHRSMIYGVAGTGKTRTLIELAKRRIADGTDPNKVLILTNGRESASQMRDAVVAGSDSTAFEPLARTLQSLAFTIINEKRSHGSLEYVLLSGGEQDSYIRSLLISEESSLEWPGELTEALRTRGFAHEVRDLLMRCNEVGITYKEFQTLGKELGEPYWPSFLEFWRKYEEILALRFDPLSGTPSRIDSSSLMHLALERLRSDHELLDLYRDKFDVIYVDQFQESDKSQRELLSMIASQDLVIAADCDSAVGRFRGADPEGVPDFAESMKLSTLHLEEQCRAPYKLSHFSEGVARLLRTRSPFRQQIHKTAEDSGDQGIMDCALLETESESAHYIAHRLREAHLRDGVAWSEMAVILRSPGSAVRALSRAFALLGIPASFDADLTSLAESPAVRPLITIAQLALGDISLTWEIADELLRSIYGGADTLAIRQIRIALAHCDEFLSHDSVTDGITPTALLLRSFTGQVPPIPWEEMPSVERIHSLISSAKKAISMKGDITDILWAIWSNARTIDGVGMAESLRSKALAGGFTGAQADRDIDAVIQLFESARRFVARMPGSTPSDFIHQILDENFVSDAIAAKGLREDTVTITTVHSSRGQEWQYVALMGLQESQWPNLRERGSLLGSERLVEALSTGLRSRQELIASTASALIDDERRLFYVALTRASRALIAVSHIEEDLQPSQYFEEIHEYLHGDAPMTTTEVPRFLSQNALVADLRRELLDPSAESHDTKEFAAGVLRVLAEAGIRSADPAIWVGARSRSTTKAIREEGDEVRVSPSNLQSFSECGVKWFMERSGGRDGDSSAQLLGSAIHAFASFMGTEKEISVEEMVERIESNWSVIEDSDGWVKQYGLDQIREKLEKFLTWSTENNRELRGVEQPFEVKIGNVIIHGTADRVEVMRDESGSERTVIVDLKSGRPDTTEVKAESNYQLAGYQLAAAYSGFTEIEVPQNLGGAELVYLGGDTKSASVRHQRPINPDEIEKDVLSMAAAMSASAFTAVANKRCERCQVRKLCPLYTEGRSVIDR